MSLSNYPPGVTGREYEIAGPDYEGDSEEICPKCGKYLIEQGYHGGRWLVCFGCDYRRDLEPIRERR